jgi:small-conductance mechanosensitive channel
MDNVLTSGALGWAIGVSVGFPLVLLATGELLLCLRRAHHPLVAPIAEIRWGFFPVLAALIVMVKVIGLNPNGIPARLVETLFWLIVANSALSFLNAILFARAKEGSWQSRAPGLLIDLIRVVLVVTCAAVILSTVWSQDLRQLVTALGVGSIVIGLALQEPLGNLFSGIMLMIERPLAVGDWLMIGTMEGVVVATNWRAIHLRTRTLDLIVLPNSVLAKQSFINQSRPTPLTEERVVLNFSPDDPPNLVKRIVADTALRTPGILSSPAPRVELVDFASSSISYVVKFCVASAAERSRVSDQLRSLIWYATKRHGLTMPFPTQTNILLNKADLEAAQSAPLPAEITRVFPRFDLANGDIAGKPVSRSEVKHYAKGERVVVEGERLLGVHLILKGEAVLNALNHAGKEVEIARLGRGEFFGEQSLVSSNVSEVTVTAAADLELLILDSEGLGAMLHRTPNLTREISCVMEARRKAISDSRTPGEASALQ